MVRRVGLLGGTGLTQGRAQHFGFMFIVFDPALLMPREQYAAQLAELIAAMKATPRKAGVDEIRIPSERAFRERARRQREGVKLEHQLLVTNTGVEIMSDYPFEARLLSH